MTTVQARRPLLVVCGEASADLYTGRLLSELRRRRPEIAPFGAGGAHCRAAGMEVVVPLEQLNVMGFSEVVARLGSLLRARRLLVQEAQRRDARAALLVDFPDFNLSLARILKRRGFRVCYYIAPTVWAWRERRLELLRRHIDLLLLIFPFEPAYFAGKGIAALFVGHPLVEATRPLQSRAQVREQLGAGPDQLLLALLPGSRPHEIHRIFPVLSAVVERLRQRRDLVVAVGTPGVSESIDRMGEVPTLRTPDLLAASDFALIKSGTATVEAAIHGVPFVVVYRASGLTWSIARSQVKVRFASMVNLIAGREVVPEFLQSRMRPNLITAAVERLLDDRGRLEQMRKDLAEVRAQLQGEGASAKGASAVDRFLSETA